MGNDLEIEIRAGSTPGTCEVEVDSPGGYGDRHHARSTPPASWADDASWPPACSPRP